MKCRGEEGQVSGGEIIPIEIAQERIRKVAHCRLIVGFELVKNLVLLGLGLNDI